MRQSVRGANLALAFLLELCALAALSYWGVQVGDNWVSRSLLGISFPFVAAVLWGLFAAPKARYPDPLFAFVVKVLVFGGATLVLFATDHPMLAVVFAVIVVANTLILRR